MLALMLDRLPGVFATSGEATFMEHWPALDSLELARRASAVVHMIGTSQQPYLNDEDSAFLADVLGRNALAAPEQSPHPAHQMYDVAMRALAQRYGKPRWAQKATSYVFCFDRILQAWPDAKLIFLLRNPLDVAASVRVRNHGALILRIIWGWNAGVQLALSLQREHPENLLLMRYEDLVTHPDLSMRRVCEFIDEPYDPACLDVPLVNPSHAAYSLWPEKIGVNPERVDAYRDVLSESEVRAITRLIDRNLLETFHPELLRGTENFGVSDWAQTARLTVAGVYALLRAQQRAFTANPSYAFDRVWQRLKLRFPALR